MVRGAHGFDVLENPQGTSTERRSTRRRSTNVIPDRWLGGYLLGHSGCTVADAVRYWQEQEVMEVEVMSGRTVS